MTPVKNTDKTPVDKTPVTKTPVTSKSKPAVSMSASSESDDEGNVFSALSRATVSPVKSLDNKQRTSKLIITSKRSFSSSEESEDDTPPSSGLVVRTAAESVSRDHDIVANVSKDPKQLSKILSDPSKWNL